MVGCALAWFFGKNHDKDSRQKNAGERSRRVGAQAFFKPTELCGVGVKKLCIGMGGENSLFPPP